MANWTTEVKNVEYGILVTHTNLESGQVHYHAYIGNVSAAANKMKNGIFGAATIRGDANEYGNTVSKAFYKDTLDDMISYLQSLAFKNKS